MITDFSRHLILTQRENMASLIGLDDNGVIGGRIGEEVCESSLFYGSWFRVQSQYLKQNPGPFENSGVRCIIMERNGVFGKVFWSGLCIVLI